MEITKETVTKLVSDLVRIESVNTWLIPSGSGERKVQQFIKEYLEERGISTTFEQVDETRFNLVGTLPGTGGGKPLTLYAHADTVGYELWKEQALVPEVRGDRLYGLGSADDKGHCAIIILAICALKESGIKLAGDVNFCFVTDEEGTTCGTIDYVKRHEPTATLVLEAAPPEYINTTHQGFGWLKITTFGKAGHGSAGGVAVDAIYHMAEVIVRLQRLQRDVFAANPHPMNGETVYHTSTINGGTDFASYPESCTLGIEIGTQPGETIENRVKEIEAIFLEVKAICPGFEGKVEVVLARNPFVAQGHEGLCRIVAEVMEETYGKPAVEVGENSWGDAQLFQDAGFPTLGIGAMGDNLHAPDEWVSIPDAVALTKVLIDVIKRYCQ